MVGHIKTADAFTTDIWASPSDKSQESSQPAYTDRFAELAYLDDEGEFDEDSFYDDEEDESLYEDDDDDDFDDDEEEDDAYFHDDDEDDEIFDDDDEEEDF